MTWEDLFSIVCEDKYLSIFNLHIVSQFIYLLLTTPRKNLHFWTRWGFLEEEEEEEELLLFN